MKSKVIREIKSIGIIILIAFTLKATIIEAYIVPTGSMENTIMTGDFLIGSKFVYGMRTPEWVGIPYTDIGFEIPFIQFPEFREPQPGDVTIFKYPRDIFQKYVKRCVAGPGDTVQVIAKQLYVNGREFKLPPEGKYVAPTLPSNLKQSGIFLSDQGNRDYFKELRIPRQGDAIRLDADTRWDYLVPIMLMDHHAVTVRRGDIEYEFTMFEPQDVIRRKKHTAPAKIQSEYFPQGTKLTPWLIKFDPTVIESLYLDEVPVSALKEYVVEQDYYWMMGDNRDDSADSRYWGFVPRCHILGEAVFSYMSLDFTTWLPRLNRIGTIIR
ncbi:MAG: signal peptidase I [Candidatus Neomarinimicrobiota bacterium]